MTAPADQSNGGGAAARQPGWGVGRDFALLSAGQVLARLLSFVVTVRLARVLTEEGFGAVAYPTPLLAYASLVVDLGFDSLGPLEVARGRTPVGDLARLVVTLRLALVAVAFAGLVAFARAVPLTEATRMVVTLYGLSLLANALDLSWVFLGGRMQPVPVADVMQQALLAAGVIAFVHGPEHIARVPLLFLGSRLVGVAWLAREFSRRHAPLRLGLDLALLRRSLPAALPLAGATAVGTVLHNLDIVLIGLWLGTSPAGLYNAAYRVVWVPTLLVVAYFNALRPVLARASVEGLQAAQPQLRRWTRIASALALGVAVGGAVVAGDLLELLFGPAFRDAAPALRVLLAAFLIFAVGRPCRLLLVAFNHQAADFAIMASAAAANVLLNIWLIPAAGVLGAAFASFASECVLLALSCAAARRRVGDPELAWGLAKPAAGALVMTAALVAASGWPVLARVALGAVLYLGLLLAWRILPLPGAGAAGRIA